MLPAILGVLPGLPFVVLASGEPGVEEFFGESDEVVGGVRFVAVLALAEEDHGPAEDVCQIQAGFADELPGADVGGQADDLALIVQVGVPVPAGNGFDVALDQGLQGGQGCVEGFGPDGLGQAGRDDQGSTAGTGWSGGGDRVGLAVAAGQFGGGIGQVCRAVGGAVLPPVVGVFSDRIPLPGLGPVVGD